MLRYLLPWLILFASCKGSDTQEQTEAAKEESGMTVKLSSEQIKTAGIVSGTLEQRILSDLISVNGVVDVPPQNIVSISFPMGGYIRSTTVLPGKKVRKGDVLCMMEDQGLVQLQQDYLVGLEKMVYLQQEFERQRELNQNNVNAAKVFQQASTELNSHKVMMKGMAEKLRLIGIDPERLNAGNLSRAIPLRSPIDGFITRVMVNTGKYVQPQDVLFELIDPRDIHAALTVFQKDVSRVTVGQDVEINYINEPGKIYKGEVILVNKSLDENRSEVVHCHFVEYPKDLLPGMFLQARIRTSPRKVMALPEEGIVSYLGKQYVFGSRGDGRFDMLAVTTGARENGYVELINADSLPQNLVTKNAHAILGALKNSAEEEH